MKPIGPLMIEHRLIEKMISIVDARIKGHEEKHQITPGFVDVVVDFVRIYADRTHHGKEEDILFRDLAEKDLSSADSAIMEELMEEHKLGRKLVAELVEAKESYLQGNKEAFSVIIDKLKAIVDFYPRHIAKEDRTFFPAAMTYLSQEEQDLMLEECWAFDRQMIHDKYRRVVDKAAEEG
jgi:hemerythrin-like domain-containing protein